MERRAFVGGAALALLASPITAQGVQQSETESANTRLVGDFCSAWAARDLQKIFPFLADDAIYRMSETTPPVTGHAGVRERLGSWMETSQAIEFRILDTWAKGPMVVNHRIDRFISTTRPLTWEGVGVFFVKNGKIQEWQDFTIRVQR